MRARTVLMWAALGMLSSGAAAFAIPLRESSRGTEAARAESTSADESKPAGEATPVREIAHFSGGKTMLVDARLGHASIARGRDGETYLYASAVATSARASDPPPLNLAIVVDRSGSMAGTRMFNAIAGAAGAVERMREGDSVTVVSFDTAATVVVPPTRVSADTRAKIIAGIKSIRLGGDTCISCGLQEAMRQLETTTLNPDQVNRIVLLSDGEPTHGVKDPAGFRKLSAGMRERGFSVSTIGVDVHYEEKVMLAIALEANGGHYFVANPTALPAVFEKEFDAIVASVATTGEFVVDLAPGVRVDEVFDRSFRQEGSKVFVPFGSVSAGQEMTLLMKLRVPADRDGEAPVAHVKVAYRDLLEHADAATEGDLALVVKSDGTAQRDMDPFVEGRVERSRTSRALSGATDLFEKGKGEEARSVLSAQLARVKEAEVASIAARKGAPEKKAGKDVADDLRSQEAQLATASSGFSAATKAAAAHGSVPAQPPQNTNAGLGAIRATAPAFRDNAF